jgi:hypothetical protein
MPRHTNERRRRAYRKWLERRAEERREELRQLAHELHREWREQQQMQAVDTSSVDGVVPVKPLV